ncbi:MAG TPA: peptidylprolyl isomerase [Dissulfurispiraceae bacterium]|nr:peptidylprolyl isomerase [Dissulfurispiraceae bacterium]
MRIWLQFLCIIVMAAIGLCSAGEGAILLDKVVAVVNSDVITWSELYKAMEFEASPQVKAMGERERHKIFEENERAFLENLIDMRLLLQEAKKDGITATDDEINKTMASIREKYGMTDEAMKEAIGKEGFTPEEYRKKLSDQIIINRLIDRDVRGKVVVTDEELNAFLASKPALSDMEEGYKISLILVKNGEDPKQAEVKAADIYRKIKAGESFSELAKKYSEDASAKAGGDLGFVSKSDLSGEFLNVLQKMKPGDVSEPFSTTAGFNIVKLDSERTYKGPAELKQAMQDKLYADKFERDYKAWIKGLRQKAYIEIR